MEARVFVEAENVIILSFGEINAMSAEIQSEWDLDEPNTGDNITRLYTEMRTQVERDEPRILRVTTHCIFFGRTSSGKSTIINALLGGRILPSEKDPVTNSFVEIMKSDGSDEYVIFPDYPNKREPIESIRRVDCWDPNKIADCSHVKLHYPVEKCPLLKDGVALIDSPGIDSDVEIDSSIQNGCSNADVLVLVVNSCERLGEAERRFLDRHKTMFSRFKILVVFNRWDEIKEDRKAVRRMEYKETASDYLRNTLNSTENSSEYEERIFFTSAKQWLEMSNSGGRPMDAEFERFVKCLKENLEESRKIRKEHIDTLNESLTKVKCCKEDLQKRLKNKFGNTLQHLEGVNDRINADVKSIFDDINYEYFFYVARKSVKTREEYLECFLKEYVCVMFESLMIKIKGTMETLIDNDHKYIINILINFCRSLYLYFSNKLKETDTSVMVNDCLEINKTIKNHKIFTILGATVAGVVLFGAVGPTIGAIAPIVNVVGRAAFGGAALAGVKIGGGSGLKSLFPEKVKALQRMLYKCQYKDQEKYLMELWNKLAEVYINSCETFTETAPETFGTLGILETEGKLRNLENLVNEFNERWGTTRGYMQ